MNFNLETRLKNLTSLHLKMNKFVDEISVFLKDKTIPLYERWEIFYEINRKKIMYKPHTSWINFESIDGSWVGYDGLYLSFSYCEYIELIDLVYDLEDAMSHDSVVEEYLGDTINRLKEEILQSGYTSVYYI